MKTLMIKIHWFLTSQMGIDLIRFIKSFPGFFKFFKDYFLFRKKYSGRIDIKPCLHDWNEESGVSNGEYFWQDLLVARMIFKNNPDTHIDIGSRIDGFVAHVASFREIEVLDIRENTAKIPGVKFIKQDVVTGDNAANESCDSISCLHALEHFGLGRCGDPVDVNGYQKGLSNISKMLKSNGALYLSIPVGVERVEFNANRVFNPTKIVKYAHINKLELSGVTIIQNDGKHKVATNIDEMNELLSQAANIQYSLCVYTFYKT